MGDSFPGSAHDFTSKNGKEGRSWGNGSAQRGVREVRSLQSGEGKYIQTPKELAKLIETRTRLPGFTYLTFQRGERMSIFSDYLPPPSLSRSAGLSRTYDKIFSEKDYQILLQLNIPRKFWLPNPGVKHEFQRRPSVNPYKVNLTAYIDEIVEASVKPFHIERPYLDIASNVTGDGAEVSAMKLQIQLNALADYLELDKEGATNYKNLQVPTSTTTTTTCDPAVGGEECSVQMVQQVLDHEQWKEDQIVWKKNRKAWTWDLDNAYFEGNPGLPSVAEYRGFLEQALLMSPLDGYVYYDFCMWTKWWSSVQVECRPQQCLPVIDDVPSKIWVTLKLGEVWFPWHRQRSALARLLHPQIPQWTTESLEANFPARNPLQWHPLRGGAFRITRSAFFYVIWPGGKIGEPRRACMEDDGRAGVVVPWYY